MDPVEGHFSRDAFYTIPLSPVPESSEVDITDVMANHPTGSIFDPPEDDNEAHSEQHELPLRSSDSISLSSPSSNVETEVRLTRSKTGSISKRASLAPEEGNGSKTVVTKRKGTKKSHGKVSKQTQVMPKMLAPLKKRVSKKQAPKDEEMKENKPPRAPRRQQKPSTSKAHEDSEILGHQPPKAPKKQQQSREGHDITGVRRKIPASSPLNTSSDVDNIAPYVSSIQDSSQILSSSQYQADHGSSMNEVTSITEAEDIKTSVSERSVKYSQKDVSVNVTSNTLHNRSSCENERGMSSRKSLDRTLESVPDHLHGDEVDGRENYPNRISLPENGEGSSTTPLSGITIKIPHSDPNKEPLALLLHQEMFKEGNTVGIKVSNGEVFVSSKHERQEPPNMNIKRNEERKSRGRSYENGWTSSESDSSTDTTCSCSSCNSYCSCCDGSTSSSSGCDHHHRRNY